jgi:hypothetical protein
MCRTAILLLAGHLSNKNQTLSRHSLYVPLRSLLLPLLPDDATE